MKSRGFALFVLGFAMSAVPALAEVTATDAWVRGTVAAQKATGVFMKLKSTEDAKLIAAGSPAAKIVEIHKMTMKGNVMEMRAVESIAGIPASTGFPSKR